MKNNQFKSNQTYFTICIYTIFVIASACIIIQLIFNWHSTLNHMREFFSHMSSFVFGILIAFMVNPLVCYINKNVLDEKFHLKHTKIRKIISILLSYIIVIGFIIICLTYVIPQLINSISELSTTLPLIYSSISRWIRTFAYHNDFLNSDMVNDFFTSLTPRIMEFSTSLASKLIPWLYSASLAIIQWFVTIIFAIVISIYLLSDKHIIFQFIKKVLYACFSEKVTKSMLQITKNCNDIFTGYIIAKAIDSLIIGLLCFIIMSILQLPYAILISVIVGITNMIPYFGPYIGAMPGIFILGVTSLKNAIIFAVMILILQQFDGLILGPRLLGNSTGVRPILILFAIIFGGAYFGVLGMFLGVPVIAVLQYLLSLIIDKRLKEKNITNV